MKGQLLKSKIVSKGFTQSTFAPLAKMTEANLSLVINGKSEVTLSTVRRIVKALDLTDEEIIEIFSLKEVM